MMAAYQPQPGAMHPGMAPHAHPGMAQGQPITAAQMQQMGHPGAVTPGPHVSQPGAMMAMQPGANAMGGPAGMGGQPPVGQMAGMPGQMGAPSMAGGGPNAHALNNMNPQAMQQHHLMQQHLQANPQLAMQQHQAMLQRRAMMAANGMAGMQQGGLQNLSPQQIAQLQQTQGVQLPQHLAQQQLMLRQQAQQAQVAAAHNQQLQQQQLALQQAQNNAQAAQPGPQNPQGAQQQHPGQPMRPQSRMANANEQTPGAPQQNPSAQPTPQPAQAQQPQQQTPQGQNNPQPSQQPNMQQQPGQPPQGMTQQQLQALTRQRQMQLQQQQQQVLQRQMQAQQAQQQQQSGQGGLFILKVVQFMDHLGSIDGVNGREIAIWHNFVDRHFAPDARFTHAFAPSPDDANGRVKRYEVPRATIARYFQTYFDSKADNLRLHLERVRETPMPPNRHQVSFESAILSVSYPNGARLEMKGSLQVLFAPGSDNIELMELYTASTEEHVNRSAIESVLSTWSPSMGNKASPKMAKNKPPKAQQKMQSQYDGLTIDHFPRVATGKLGITSRVQQFLELDETMCVMADLVALAAERKIRPEQALETIVAHYQSQGGPDALQHQATPQFNFPPNGVAMGQRTPSMQSMGMPNAGPQGQFSSPAVSHLNLPMQNGIAGMNGSPHIPNHLVPNLNMANSHTPSPHQMPMAAPAMVPQHSQQGTNSSAASANTSPNVNNKRRRSQVKMEGGDDGSGADGGPGGNRITKPSPRMTKKPKPGS